jgi:hypothetical protein
VDAANTQTKISHEKKIQKLITIAVIVLLGSAIKRNLWPTSTQSGKGIQKLSTKADIAVLCLAIKRDLWQTSSELVPLAQLECCSPEFYKRTARKKLQTCRIRARCKIGMPRCCFVTTSCTHKQKTMKMLAFTVH